MRDNKTISLQIYRIYKWLTTAILCIVLIGYGPSVSAQSTSFLEANGVLPNGTSSSSSSSSSSCDSLSNAVSPHYQYVTAELGLNIRSGPSTGNSQIGVLQYGEKVKVIGKAGSWRRISRLSHCAFVHSGYLSESQPTGSSSSHDQNTQVSEHPETYGPQTDLNVSDYHATVTASALNVRMGPGTEYGIHKSLLYGSTVTVTHHQGIWLRITWNGALAYVHGNYLKRDDPFEGASDPEGLAPGSKGSSESLQSNDQINNTEQNSLNIVTLNSEHNIDLTLSSLSNALPTNEELLRKVHEQFRALTNDQFWHHPNANVLFNQILSEYRIRYPEAVKATHILFAGSTYGMYWEYPDGPNNVKFHETANRVNQELWLPGTEWYEGCLAAKDAAEATYNDRSQSACSPEDRLYWGMLLLDVATLGKVRIAREALEQLIKESAEQGGRQLTQQLKQQVANDFESRIKAELALEVIRHSDQVADEVLEKISEELAEELMTIVSRELSTGQTRTIAAQASQELAIKLEADLLKLGLSRLLVKELSHEIVEEILETKLVEILEQHSELAPS